VLAWTGHNFPRLYVTPLQRRMPREFTREHFSKHITQLGVNRRERACWRIYHLARNVSTVLAELEEASRVYIHARKPRSGHSIAPKL
jgi:hypothetical protein